jgi:hypothetical protein
MAYKVQPYSLVSLYSAIQFQPRFQVPFVVHRCTAPVSALLVFSCRLMHIKAFYLSQNMIRASDTSPALENHNVRPAPSLAVCRLALTHVGTTVATIL